MVIESRYQRVAEGKSHPSKLIFVQKFHQVAASFYLVRTTLHVSSCGAVYAGIRNLLAVILFPILMYSFQMGATGAAISTVVSQYVVTFLILWFLNKRAILLPPKMGSLQFGGYIKSSKFGSFLLGRTLAVLTTMTLGTSMAARQGPVAMTAHQICIQVWLAVSLLVDALGASAHALSASYMFRGDYKTVKEIAHYVLKVRLLKGSITFNNILYVTERQEIYHISYVRQAFEDASLRFFLEILESDLLNESDGPVAGYRSVLRTFIYAFIASYEINIQLEDRPRILRCV
ncbi:protein DETOXIFICATION 45, chloroplastic-like [Humulus lupulus]|uniref:protein DETOXIFICATION 45, chloroplastic-like n=1 Tax=Humulus lupulus TaxID=3486 RepID=UPI002B413A8D|nr:protein DETOXIFICATION 45, chloroplastic-like [Humulus lupulus]